MSAAFPGRAPHASVMQKVNQMLDRAAINNLPTEELARLDLKTETLANADVMLIGFQRTKQISKASRQAWETGDTAPMAAEVDTRHQAIIEGALAEIWQEYLPLRDYLNSEGLRPTHVADVGCGAAINDLFLAHDFDCSFTLIDIEETPTQYHGWADSGAGYASLDSAQALLRANGVTESTAINPKQSPDAVADVKADLATSLYSCGFHYPVDGYLDLFGRVIGSGGTVVLDLRGRYYRRRQGGLAQLLDMGNVTELYHDERSVRVAVRS